MDIRLEEKYKVLFLRYLSRWPLDTYSVQKVEGDLYKGGMEGGKEGGT